MATNSDVDLDTTDNSAYLFVPTVGGSSSTPGAMLRLGSYCDKETAADDDATAKLFYPSQFVAENTANIATIYTLASGKDGSGNVLGGILLACDGVALVKAGKQMYVNCGGALHVESGDAVTIKSGGKAGNNINIDAGAEGEIKETAKTKTATILGNDFTETSKDSYTINHGDTVAITYGTKTFITLGSQQSVSVGGVFAGNLSGGVTVSVGIYFTANLSAAFSYTLLSVGLTQFGFSKTVTDLKAKDMTIKNELATIRSSVMDVANKQLALKNSVTALENQPVQVVNNNTTLVQNNIDMRTTNVLVNMGNLAVFT